MDEVRNMGQIRITLDDLVGLLRFPPGTQARRASIDVGQCQQELVLVVEHPDLPVTYPSSTIRTVQPWYDANGFVSWGI